MARSTTGSRSFTGSCFSGSAFTVDTTLAITDGRVRSANLVATDVVASNGVIHVIDRVLLPAVAR